MKHFHFLLVLLILAQAFPAQVPYYGSADLTPRWHGTWHRVAPAGLYQPPQEPYVLRFFFTRCGSICPTLTANLRAVAAPVVSISVDPEDTAESMAAYARREGLPASWSFVSPPIPVVHGFARQSLFCGPEDFRRTASGKEVMHSEKLFLVDDSGRLRGVYNGSLRLEVDNLREDLARLHNPASSH
jgi:protein SCO1/2